MKHLIGKIICWWEKEHDWGRWTYELYGDGETHYWKRICKRCDKWEVVRNL